MIRINALHAFKRSLEILYRILEQVTHTHKMTFMPFAPHTINESVMWKHTDTERGRKREKGDANNLQV